MAITYSASGFSAHLDKPYSGNSIVVDGVSSQKLTVVKQNLSEYFASKTLERKRDWITLETRALALRTLSEKLQGTQVDYSLDAESLSVSGVGAISNSLRVWNAAGSTV